MSGTIGPAKSQKVGARSSIAEAALSPDGKALAFVRESAPRGSSDAGFTSLRAGWKPG
jgi:hypothetical protein